MIRIVASLALAAAIIGIALNISKVGALDLPSMVEVSICGDGRVDGLEACDYGRGFNIGTYGSSTAERQCMPGCMSFGPYCGDSILQVRFQEQCDDGNNSPDDLCEPNCIAVPSAPPTVGGQPTVGSTPFVPNARPGSILSELQTKVVLRGKAYPNSSVNILLDGKLAGIVQADSNADFFFTTTKVTPGTSNFGFWARDPAGNDSITTSVVFEVAQSAVSSLVNILIPPTTVATPKEINPGDTFTLGGYAPPAAKLTAVMTSNDASTLSATADASGKWDIRVDTVSIKQGNYFARAKYALPGSLESGYGKTIAFVIGKALAGSKSPDLNKDGKVNLIDFSIFLTLWGKSGIADFNDDEKTNLADFSIMLFAWTG